MENEKQELVNELRALLEQDVMEVKEKVEQVKNQFYRVYHQELEAAKKAAEEAAEAAGEVLENWLPETDETEQTMRELLAQYKQKKQAFTQKLEAEMAQNLLRKENILEQMKQMAADATENVMDNLQKMKDLQAEWKTIGQVPAQKVQDIWKQYQQWQEQFYDLVKINIELRDLDFKKNLELKTLLCEAAEKLQENASVVEANRALQQLHDEWAEIGPVAREMREEIWNRFKAASTVINKKHQAYFDELHKQEQENLTKKQAIIEQIKSLIDPMPTTNKQWDEVQTKVQTLQDEWRTIGFAPKKFNQSIYDEYRTLCNQFYKEKSEFFKKLHDELNGNLKAKKELIERAKAMLESEDWQSHTEDFIQLQKEWRTIGAIPRKYSDEYWKLFKDTCDAFFDRKHEANKSEREENNKSRMEKAMQGSDKAKLMRIYENLNQEIKTAENNILFFTAKSKGANQLVVDMQKKIDTLKKQREEILEKLNQTEE